MEIDGGEELQPGCQGSRGKHKMRDLDEGRTASPPFRMLANDQPSPRILLISHAYEFRSSVCYVEFGGGDHLSCLILRRAQDPPWALLGPLRHY